ncbi:DUF262 domain-containing HNH endonuclease family protein [Thiothrix unzii]|jgi:hypothetical protein|uniref:DUF262 domain-containing protein n=1 Tax=Thiothrix unzii TaxID=111769 RepID=UPI002A366D72|nr:DUF262 domain-containing HNH endonuclease family protein [Thiothrix unzii]MDX9989398.1 DUF262 domain-containing HNH endonuclease family protein [Thiothrix unzii]
MEASTTIRKMLAGNQLIVPTYQRAYSWDTSKENGVQKLHTGVFLDDLNEYNKSNAKASYYFGHFLFEEKNGVYYVIDGQQRLTTIIIFLSALFKNMKLIRSLNDEEQDCFEDTIKRRATYRFSTVDYDNRFFKEYVIDQSISNKRVVETESARRIAEAFDYFDGQLENKDEEYLEKMLKTISSASCTTYLVEDESEAIQMFIFQNNRGKKPSNLEILKAQFMYNIHLYAGENKDGLIQDVKEKFEGIYKSIASIEYKVSEDDILTYTLRVYFNSLWEDKPLERIGKILAEDQSVKFIEKFTQSLAESFTFLSKFFVSDERDSIAIHSLIALGRIGIALPFIIKAYKFNLSIYEISNLCETLESLILRHRLIGTKAEMTTRINDVFESFTEKNKDTKPIIERISWMKTTDEWWWAYWSNENLKNSLQGDLNHSVAKYLLWKYENYLEAKGKSGYMSTRFDKVKSPELEHIAPRTKPEVKNHGYGVYDEVFEKEYLNCIGNYLLVSKSHNCSVGNIPFQEKLKTYTSLFQHREVNDFVGDNNKWGKTAIGKRKKKIIGFVLENL